MYSLLRSILFQLDAERSHHISLNSLKLAEKLKLTGMLAKPAVDDPVEVMGIKFPNRVGLAAGLDKNGEYVDALSRMGFGFVEVGTVTPRPQPGNPKPRLFRIKQAEAIVNRMGFNNDGVEQLLQNVAKARFDGVLGINIGKNFDTPVEKAVDDYLIGMEKIYTRADYMVVNISSPNTPGLRDLQFGDTLKDLLDNLKKKQQQLHQEHKVYKPLAIKIAPDLSNDNIQELADTFNQYELDGVIATNTTFDRSQVQGMKNADEQGGLSGKPLSNQSTKVIKRLVNVMGDKIPVIGVGGITDPESAIEKLEAGARLVQIYSGFIYHGPQLVHDVARAIKEHYAVK
ncbi:quinone-dependent dihydroorotate dehydrogenase [Kangiella sediminilitoris]|uniref:Dihydroorotate dehydrogenase (quinone) n=1 Tax=Kangiella sediminilitoris TaxID=1144748 RepID=A0A1B3B9D6_9GAMM|nr:quinone-dependent dihydroorotate dehydrogenase [Kangiella sediminilitoris]AOE49400.1 Dihydroorotate dehydrogenase (quinone) [Kangiella sediminilitoris]